MAALDKNSLLSHIETELETVQRIRYQVSYQEGIYYRGMERALSSIKNHILCGAFDLEEQANSVSMDCKQ